MVLSSRHNQRRCDTPCRCRRCLRRDLPASCSCRQSTHQRSSEGVLRAGCACRRAGDLGLVIKILTSTDGVPALAQQLSDGVLYAAILMPAGFFLSVTGRDPQKPSRLFILLWIGAASLTVGLISAGVGLIMAGTRWRARASTAGGAGVRWHECGSPDRHVAAHARVAAAKHATSHRARAGESGTRRETYEVQQTTADITVDGSANWLPGSCSRRCRVLPGRRLAWCWFMVPATAAGSP